MTKDKVDSLIAKAKTEMQNAKKAKKEYKKSKKSSTTTTSTQTVIKKYARQLVL